MRKRIIEIDELEIGDRVQTPRGIGIVIDSYFDDYLSRVCVQHNEGDEHNPSNKPQWMEMNIPIFLGEKQ